jgi:hypothetical protein
MRYLFFVLILLVSFHLFSEEEQGLETESDNSSDKTVELQKEINDIKEQSLKRDSAVERSEKEIAELKKELVELKETLKKEKQEKLEAEQLAEQEKKQEQEAQEEEIIDFRPYGFIELYGYANDAQFLSNDLMVYVLDKNRSTVGMSARNTRLGLEISVPYIEVVDISAILEIDFVGSLPDTGNAESSTGIRMRHAFFKVSKTFSTDTTLALRAGQTWLTAIIPIFPCMINPAGGWGAGNLWNRLPLAELELAQKAGNFDFGLKGSIVKPITGTSANRRNFIEVNIDAGNASHWPGLQGQLYLKFKTPSIDVFWAAGGAYGREDYTSGVKVNNGDSILFGNEVEVWMFNTALKVVHKYAELQGKYFIGENLDMFGYFGGSVVKKDGIVTESMRATGFWTELSMKPFKTLKLSVGLGSEYNNHKLAVYNQNDVFWLSLFYTFFDHITPGFQWQQVITEKDDNKQTGNAFLGSLKFSF